MRPSSRWLPTNRGHFLNGRPVSPAVLVDRVINHSESICPGPRKAGSCDNRFITNRFSAVIQHKHGRQRKRIIKEPIDVDRRHIVVHAKHFRIDVTRALLFVWEARRLSKCPFSDEMRTGGHEGRVAEQFNCAIGHNRISDPVKSAEPSAFGLPDQVLESAKVEGNAAGGEKKDAADMATFPIGRRSSDAKLPDELQKFVGRKMLGGEASAE
jgi:hypothetical protein